MRRSKTVLQYGRLTFSRKALILPTRASLAPARRSIFESRLLACKATAIPFFLAMCFVTLLTDFGILRTSSFNVAWAKIKKVWLGVSNSLWTVESRWNFRVLRHGAGGDHRFGTDFCLAQIGLVTYGVGVMSAGISCRAARNNLYAI
jgi:hypothetical protein